MRARRIHRMPLGLRRVMRLLRRIHDRPAPQLDPTHAREQMFRMLDSVGRHHVDAEIEEFVDRYIESYIANWLTQMYRNHSAELNELDLLNVKVRPYLDRLKALNHDAYSRLVHLDMAVDHALDRLSDPDTPYVDRLQRPMRRDP